MDLDSTIESYLPPKKKLRPEKSRQTASKKISEKKEPRSRKPVADLSQYRFDPSSADNAKDGEPKNTAKNELEKLTELMEDSFSDKILNEKPREHVDADEKTHLKETESKTKSRSATAKAKTITEKKPTKTKSEAKSKRLSGNGRRNRSMVNLLNSDVKTVCSQAMLALKSELSDTKTELLSVKIIDYSQKQNSMDLNKEQESLWKLSSKLIENFNTDVINVAQNDDNQLSERNESIEPPVKSRVLYQHSTECRICRKPQAQLGLDLVKLLQPQFSHLQMEAINCSSGTIPVAGLIYQLRVENPAYDLQQFSIEVVRDFVYFMYSGCLPTPLYEDSLLALKMIAQITCCVSLADSVTSHIDKHERESINSCPGNVDKQAVFRDPQESCDSQIEDDAFVDSLWIATANEPHLDLSQVVVDQKMDQDQNDSEANLFDDEEEEFFNFLDRTQLNKSLLHVSFSKSENENCPNERKISELNHYCGQTELASCNSFIDSALSMTNCANELSKNDNEMIPESDLESSVLNKESESVNCKSAEMRRESEVQISDIVQDRGTNDKTQELCSEDVIVEMSFEYELGEVRKQNAEFGQKMEPKIVDEIYDHTTNDQRDSDVDNSEPLESNIAIKSLRNMDQSSITESFESNALNSPAMNLSRTLSPTVYEAKPSEQKLGVDNDQMENQDVILETEESDIDRAEIRSSQSTESLIEASDDVRGGSISPLIGTDDSDDDVSVVCEIDLRTRLKMSSQSQPSFAEKSGQVNILCKDKVTIRSLEMQNIDSLDHGLELQRFDSRSEFDDSKISSQIKNTIPPKLPLATQSSCLLSEEKSCSQTSQVEDKTKSRIKQPKKPKRTEPTFEDVIDFVKKSPHIWCKMLQYKPIHLLSFKNEFEENNPNFKVKDSLLKSYFDQMGAFCSEKLISTV